ncbi:MAG: hypothetical protein K9K86_01710 [Pseudomonadales bacterium]|nr:hypothetical protein [Pseudomonadales bacterium]
MRAAIIHALSRLGNEWLQATIVGQAGEMRYADKHNAQSVAHLVRQRAPSVLPPDGVTGSAPRCCYRAVSTIEKYIFEERYEPFSPFRCQAQRRGN